MKPSKNSGSTDQTKLSEQDDEAKLLGRSLQFADFAIAQEKERRLGLKHPESDDIAFSLSLNGAFVHINNLPFTDIPEIIQQHTTPTDLFSFAIRLFTLALNPTHVLTIATALGVDRCPKCGEQLRNTSPDYETAECNACGAKDFGTVPDNPYHEEELVAMLYVRGYTKSITWQYKVLRDGLDSIHDYQLIKEKDIQQPTGKLADFWNPLALAPWMVPQIGANLPVVIKAFGRTVTPAQTHMAASAFALASKIMPEVPILELDPDFLLALKHGISGGVDAALN